MLIQVDTSSILDQFPNASQNTIDAFVDYVVKEITVSYARRLEGQAKLYLHQTRMTYVRNIKILDEGRMKGAVLLDYSKNKIVRMLEEGATPFDMKIGFQKSSKVKYNKDGGWYLTIPFREGNPDAVGESDIFSSIMPNEVYQAAKEKEQNIPTKDGGLKSQGLKELEVPEKYRMPKTRTAISIENKTFEEYKNKTSIYTGISKMNDSVTGQNIYMSFRRVGENSDDNAFIHTGIQAYNLMDKAMLELDSQMGFELNNATNQGIQILQI